jgi:hypothetical protein
MKGGPREFQSRKPADKPTMAALGVKTVFMDGR